jgi:hypothetical protein
LVCLWLDSFRCDVATRLMQQEVDLAEDGNHLRYAAIAETTRLRQKCYHSGRNDIFVF